MSKQRSAISKGITFNTQTHSWALVCFCLPLCVCIHFQQPGRLQEILSQEKVCAKEEQMVYL